MTALRDSLARVAELSGKGTAGPFTVGHIDSDGGRIDAPGFEQVAYVWQEQRRFLPSDSDTATGPVFGTIDPATNAALIAAAVNLIREHGDALAGMVDRDAAVAELIAAVRELRIVQRNLDYDDPDGTRIEDLESAYGRLDTALANIGGGN